MKIECVGAVQRAIGRPLTVAEQRGLDERITSTMRRLASREPERWRTMPRAERLREAGRVIAEDLDAAVQKREERVKLQIDAHARHLPEIEIAGRDGFDVVMRKLDQAERFVKGVHRQYLRQALDLMDWATKNDTGPMGTRALRWVSNLEDPTKVLAFAREVFGKDSGDPKAKAAAKAWVDTVEAMRERFNRAGGDVRKLMYGYLPQPHDAEALTRAGIQAWVGDVIKLVDRGRYTDTSGRMLNDGELANVLEQAWRDIATDGLASAELGAYRGESAIANAGSQARVLHFKDGDAWVSYLAKYGQGTAFDALSGHVRWMARNIGMVETFGPNPAATYRTMHDTAKLAGGSDRVAGIMTVEDAWGTLTGAFDNPRSQTMSRINQGFRNIQVAGKLQQATLSAVSDIPLYFVTLGYHRLPMMRGMVNLMQAYGSDTKHFADVSGLMSESMISDMHRWGEGMMGKGFTDRLATATMKLSLLQALTDGTRRAFSVGMMAGMAKLSRTPWAELQPLDRARLERAGWTPDEWATLQRVAPETWRNTPMLTPAAIAKAEGLTPAERDTAMSRLLGIIVDEAEYASPNPDLRTRTLQAGSLQRGTGKGELWRHLMLFKGFSLSMIFRHWDRALHGDMSPAGKLAYTSALLAIMPVFGGLALLLQDIASGRDPRDVTGDMGDDPAKLIKFWGAAMAKGGGLGFLGDMLLSGMGSHGQSGASAAIGGIAGPSVGSAFELLYDVGLENVMEAAQGDETHAGAEAFRWARGHAPFVNLWQAKLVIDRAVLDQAQELLSPGYLAKTRTRMERQWGSTYYWEPTDSGLATGDMQGPERSPSFASMVGDGG